MMTAQKAWARTARGIAALERRRALLYAEARLTHNGSGHHTALLNEIDAIDGALFTVRLGCPIALPDGSVRFDAMADPADHLPALEAT